MKYIGYRLIVSIIDGSAKDRDSYAFHDLKFMNKISIPKNQMKNHHQIGPKFKLREIQRSRLNMLRHPIGTV